MSTVGVAAALFGADAVASLGGGDAVEASFATIGCDGLLGVAFGHEVVGANGRLGSTDLGSLDVNTLQSVGTGSSVARFGTWEDTELAAAAAGCNTGSFDVLATAGVCGTISICAACATFAAEAAFGVRCHTLAGRLTALFAIGWVSFASFTVGYIAFGCFGPANFAGALEVTTEGFTGAVGVGSTGLEATSEGVATRAQVDTSCTGCLTLVALAVTLGEFDTDAAAEVDTVQVFLTKLRRIVFFISLDTTSCAVVEVSGGDANAVGATALESLAVLS